jgi:hypothetical protein
MPATQDQALTILKRRFSLWRLHRAKGTHIPQDLWQAAMNAARKYGVWRVSEKLRIHRESLKRRLDREPQAATGGGPIQFVEIPREVLPPSPGCVVELQDREGLRLRIELRDGQSAENVARSLWKERR